ncbi:MAG: metal ABC transporter permease, partial [Alphaproteobacteria bacterium]|nr:metal ABC transporter permease [Alphaproteobacteria bacterium]
MTWSLDDFVVRALIAGIGVALVAGPLGCFIIWRRMAFFGATMSHAALLGVSLAFLLNINVTLGIIGACTVTALILLSLMRLRVLPSDTLLGLLAHASLALGLVAISFQDTLRIDLLSLLFGDILSVSRGDLGWILGGGALALATLAAIWRPLLSATVHEELAQVEGVRVRLVQATFVLVMAVVVAIAMKIVGLLLIISMLLIPPAVARRFATTPEVMAFVAALVGVLSVIGGIEASLVWDTPAGPSI